MISINDTKCPICNGNLQYYDHVKRIVRTRWKKINYIFLRRYRCQKCHAVHREIPDSILPYKQYEAEVIRGVIDGLITCETLGFEDCPCELTMLNWIRTQNLQSL